MRERLGDMLVRLRLVSPQMLDAALKAQMIYGGRVGANLVELGHLDIDKLAELLAQQSGCPIATQAALEQIPESVLKHLKSALAEKLLAVPFALNGRRLSMAMCDPQSPLHIDQLSFATGMRIVPFVCPELRVYYFLERWYGVKRPARYIRLAPERTFVPPGPVHAPSSSPSAMASPGRVSEPGLFG